MLVIADHFGYPGGVAHGVTTYFLEVLPALVEAGVEVHTCFMREPHPAADALRERGITPNFLSAARMDPTVAFRVAAIARRTGCTILHAAGVKGTLMARMATTLVPARTMLHLHDLGRPGTFVSGMHRLFARPSELAVCVSRAVTPIAIDDFHVHPDRVRVVHNGIHLERFRRVPADVRDRMRQSLGIAGKTHVIGMVARMHPVKGHRTMLRMMPRIVQGCPDVLLLLAGDGPERAACEALVGELGMNGHVKFLGQRSDIPELLSACDIVVMPSESEGLPNRRDRGVCHGKTGGRDSTSVASATSSTTATRATLCLTRIRKPSSGAVLSLLLDADTYKAFAARAWRAAERFTVEKSRAPVVELLPGARRLMGAVLALKNAWRKNEAEFRGLFNGALPSFVSARRPPDTLDGVPVFGFHLIEPEQFEADLALPGP